jgi:2-dehydropantoate 2-reductase
MTRYIIIGAGAVGGTIGARLFEGGHDVVLVARGAHYHALRDHGLRFLTPDDERTLQIPATDGPDALAPGPDDVLILATKTQDSAAALDAWAARTLPGTDPAPVILAQNGVENERIALRRFPRVYGMCVWLPSTHLEPGVVEAQGVPVSGILHLGRYPDGEDDFIRQVGEDLEKSGFRAPVCPDVMRWKYSKLLGNLSNSVQALCGRDASGAHEALHDRVHAEGVAVLEAAGIPFVSREEAAPLRSQLRLAPVAGTERSGGSSWQSLARGTGTIESDYLNGEIALLGRMHGVPTPVNAALQRLATRYARERRAAGSLSVAELTAYIDQAAEAANR